MATIKPLPEASASQIKSSIIIPSLSEAVLGLFRNSLDSQATTINVGVNFSRGCCSVEDDGYGISPLDFLEGGGLGKMHHSSKYGIESQVYGKDGTLLSAVAALSILRIVSRHYSYEHTNGIIFHHSRPVTKLCPVPDYQDIASKNHGTKVIVQDLFGNMPVRVKQRPQGVEGLGTREKKWAQLCKCVIAHLLAWGKPVSLSMQGTDKDHILRIKYPISHFKPCIQPEPRTAHLSSFNESTIKTILTQGCHVNRIKCANWVQTSARTKRWMIRGLISLDPSPSKATQFISIGMHYLEGSHCCNILYDEINHLFASSNFGNRGEGLHPESRMVKHDNGKVSGSDDFMNKQAKGSSKGADRWPMFFIRIEQRCDQKWQAAQGEETQSEAVKDIDLSTIRDVLQAMVARFLLEQNFNPSGRRLARKHPKCAIREALGRSGHHFHSNAGTLSSYPNNESLPRGQPTEELGYTVKFPLHSKKYQNPHQLSSDFSTWSRIKVGARVISSQVKATPDSPRPGEKNDTLLEISPLIPAPSDCTSEMIGFGELSNKGDGVAMHSSQPSHLPNQIDKVIPWVDVKSRDTLLVNARTGAVMPPVTFHLSPDNHSTAVTLAHRSRLAHSGDLKITEPCPDLHPVAGSWVDSFLKTWKNPVFENAEECIPRLSPELCIFGSNMDKRSHTKSFLKMDAAFEMPTNRTGTKLNKESLKKAIVINQVDDKFILIKMHADNEDAFQVGSTAEGDNLLVLIDQHAADERVRVEALMNALCRPPPEMIRNYKSLLGHASKIDTVILSDPLTFKIHVSERKVFQNCAAHFARWGILYNLFPVCIGISETTHESQSQPSQDNCKLVVITLPEPIAERCRVERKHLENLMRTEAWEVMESHMDQDERLIHEAQEQMETNSSWPQYMHACPQGILDMINSRSCRSAIMFNDKLSASECQDLIQRLATCHFPFYCAHGRPSMIPLVNLGVGGATSLGMDESRLHEAKPDKSFLNCWKAWNMNADAEKWD